jgi:hypothetical protein
MDFLAAVSGTKRHGHAPVYRGHYYPYEIIDVLIFLIYCACLLALLLILVAIVRVIIAAMRDCKDPPLRHRGEVEALIQPLPQTPSPLSHSSRDKRNIPSPLSRRDYSP